MNMKEAIKKNIQDGDTLIIGGFTHLICFAAGHEIIRQKKKNLVACRLTPDLIYDQMIAAGCVKKLVFSWAGNPGVGPLYVKRAYLARLRSKSTHILAWSPDSWPGPRSFPSCI